MGYANVDTREGTVPITFVPPIPDSSESFLRQLENARQQADDGHTSYKNTKE
jgi:hypothetical protein